MSSPRLRRAETGDLPRLLELENGCFQTDRISRRSFLHWLSGDTAVFLVVEEGGRVLGYGLVLLHKATCLARLYSIALDPAARGRGLAGILLTGLERGALKRNRTYMRLEVDKSNSPAIQLYERMGYRIFGEKPDYYGEHRDALRMQKQIRYPGETSKADHVPWYRQCTAFTCGPASLMMCMAALKNDLELTPSLELDLWREATTIFMTSGHGGCHPLGLALAARRRGFEPEVVMSQSGPLFTDGVRTRHKKEVLALVHRQFEERCIEQQIRFHIRAVTIDELETRRNRGEQVLVMISSYRLNGDKAPHWVVVTAVDDCCVFLHDPDVEKLTHSDLDCRHIPVAKTEFARMIPYGRNRFSSAVFLK